jgi:hypothetical protein
MYVKARHEQQILDFAFKTYITDSIYLEKQNPPKCMGKRWCEIVRPHRIEDVDADALVIDIIQKAGLEVKNESIRPSNESRA